MNYIEITKQNIDREHICCALGAKQYEQAVLEKKQWLSARMDDGLTFYRLNGRAKVFIEYLPAEKAWVPIVAPNYMFVNCLWVSGRYKNQGHGKQLLEKCKKDAMALGMDGIVHIVGKKKLPYLSDKNYFEYMGFEVVDKSEPYFELMALKWSNSAPTPAFNISYVSDAEDIHIYYTAQCPFAVGVLEELREVASNRGFAFHTHRIQSREEAQKAPTAWTTFSLFYNGRFVTHEILSPNKFEKLLNDLK
ncbi:N-acetyltransferase [Paenibacillus sp. WQ 127069]|uniref:N-acetyltransferase n=1 Tax=Paenibacillus baimaensis TaxID=2982185 RepID=A0ABT2UWE9_9BACL|nr:N-acetyltransferase [Paenibacillus sp. WQ 127069]MCU6798132.1 N-acetyltransferase [Paenibacillus sp. WQ 127069]